MKTKLNRIRERSEQVPSTVFTSIGHLINEEMLCLCHQELKANKAVGIDGITKVQYGEHLESNVQKLVQKLKRKAYHPKPVERIYIPKSDGISKRPLGISSYEDKLVQLALKKLMEAVFEPHFLPFSYGFRPGRNAHTALQEVTVILERHKVNHIVDTDIQGFFDHVDHTILMRCIQKRITDPNILRLVHRFLKAGLIEEDQWKPTTKGTSQGSILSPLLGNIYLHYVLDLWFAKAVKRNMRGEAYLIRYADDFLGAFQYRQDAENFYKALQHRLAKFALSIQQEKSKIIEFGRFAVHDCQRRDGSKPDTFDFLGFTHYCSRSRNDKFRVKRKTCKKKFARSLREMGRWIKVHRNMRKHLFMKMIGIKLVGHYRYYGVTDNFRMLNQYSHETKKLLFKWWNRRSQRKSFSYKQFYQYLEQFPLPAPTIYFNVYAHCHDYPIPGKSQ
jgi:RNA-directed DNA polymerase